jgi:hypothetical protein
LIALTRWDEAAVQLESLPPQQQQGSRVRRLSGRVDKERTRAAAQADREAKQAAATQQREAKEAEKQARLDERASRREETGNATAPGPTSDPTVAVSTPATAAGESTSETAGEPSGDTLDPAPAGQVALPASGEASATEPTGVEPPALASEEIAALAQARSLARGAALSTDLDEPMRLARPVADRHPDHREAQHLVAEIAYRSSDWTTAVRYFERGGDPAADQSILLFYQAIALFESGDPTRAASALRRSLPGLKRDLWVQQYVDKILGPEGNSR